ncbi:hypothetical protein FHS27_006544 [Rhodopirellula rubra]|uniref:Uncharacterized protein n=1 Tax=Aporhodopirellula rubra TaxID=980271 RepID=A0A7W5HA18_9BACT|nr:hypothetical protein [Aporhodopirellula rubra]MBB3210696.1 hypothetical protein [Aporhodopirellula rubra]
MAIKKNDWVRSYSAGVWRVLSEVPAHYEMRTSPDEPKELYDGPLYIVKRIVNNKWKRAFEMEAAHAAFVKPLNKADTKKLEAFITQNNGILDAFDSFGRQLQCILNIGFALKRKSDLKKLREEVATALDGNLAKGVSAPAIAKAIASTSCAALCNTYPQSATLQFVNFNYEIRRRELIYREMNALDF